WAAEKWYVPSLSRIETQRRRERHVEIFSLHACRCRERRLDRGRGRRSCCGTEREERNPELRPGLGDRLDDQPADDGRFPATREWPRSGDVRSEASLHPEWLRATDLSRG